MGVNLDIRRIISVGIILAFLANTLGITPVYAQSVQAQVFHLPAPGVRVGLSPEYNPPILKGIKVHPDNPFRFDFILDQGDSTVIPVSSTATRLIKYFLASLTIPEKDLWVNLSPYEKDRIVPDSFGLTEMGRDLLAEDYMLKQITASLIYPEGETGKRFWKRVYEQAAQKFGTTNIPVNTFNKVWIVPEKAVVYENAKAGTAYVVESKLKVMLEQDYLSLAKHTVILSEAKDLKNDVNAIGSQIIREIVIPELTKEVNEDKNFSQLRQVYNSLILATWYKKKIRDSILERVYTNRNKVAGVGYKNSINVEAIYQRYLQAFKKGVYNYIKEEQDPVTQETIPRKYFSGGVNETNLSLTLKTTDHMDAAQLSQIQSGQPSLRVTIDLAMSSRSEAPTASPADLPESFNFQEFIKNDVIAQFPQDTEEQRMRYSPSRIRLSIPDSLIFNTTLQDEGKFYIDFILREILLNALNAQPEGQVEVSFKDNVVYIKNKGNLFSRMWEGYHRLLNNHMLWVAHDPADGSIIDFISKGSLPDPDSFKEGSEGYITAVKEKALYSEASEGEVNKLFETPQGRNLLFFLRKYISFSGVEGTQGYGIFVINGLSNKLGARLLLADDGEKSGTVEFAIKFSNEAGAPATFTDQAMEAGGNTLKVITDLISPLPKSRSVNDVADEIRRRLLENNIGMRLEYISDGRDKKPNDDKYTRFYSLIDPQSGKRVIIVSLPDGRIEYRYREAVITYPHEIPVPKAEGASAIIERIREYIINANKRFNAPVIDTAWVFGSRANGDWARDIDDADVFMRVSSPEYLNEDVRVQTEVMMHQMLFEKDTGYIPAFDVYLYYNPKNDGTFLEDPQTQYMQSDISGKLRIGLMFKVPLQDSAQMAQPPADRAMNSMRNELKRLAYHDANYRRGAVDLLSKHLNDDNITQWSLPIISNFIDPVGMSEAQEFFNEKGMHGSFNTETARRNARWASLFALKFDVFRVTQGNAELKRSFQEWITQRIKEEIGLWLESHHLNGRGPEVLSGTKDEIGLIKTHHLGHVAKMVPKEFAFLENIRLIYLATQMRRRGEIKDFVIESWVYSSIENMVLGAELSPTERAVIFAGVEQEYWDQLRVNMDRYIAVFSNPSVGIYFDILVNNAMSIGNDNGMDLEGARLKALETNGGFKEGFVEVVGGKMRLIRNNGPTIRQMRQQHNQPQRVEGKQFVQALAAKFDEEYIEAWNDGAKANNMAELQRHLVNLLEVAMTIKNMTHGDSAMINQARSAVSVSRGITVETLANAAEMSLRVARGMADTLILNNRSGKPTVFICPTGGTQDGIYAAFVGILEKEHIDFTNLNTFNMDEYYVGPRYQGNWAKNPQSYRYYMEQHLFSKLRALNPKWNDDNSRVHFLDGQAPDIREETARYEKEFQYFRDSVGISLGIGGIGRDGHIAFNEPIIPVLDSRLMDDKKIINFNEFWVKADKSNWGNAIHRLLYRHWSLRETPVITNYLENEFLQAGIEVNREDVYLLSKKLISQKVTIYLDGLQASDIEELNGVAKDAMKTFRINRLTVEFKNSGTIFNSRTHAVQLSIPTIIDNSRFFSDLDEIPLTALTIGLGTIKDAKKIIIAATGPKKQEAVYSAVAEPESPEVSASSLQWRKNVTFVIDTDAGRLYRQSHAGKSVQSTLQASDQAMNANAEKGGIDLTPANMNLQTQNAGGGIKFNLDPAMLERLQNAPGFVPVIINVQPMTDLRQFLGIQDNAAAPAV
jgi:6-phosphogluconolactonase/glucosamine-6-phosphate isomerase/deaminase/predicted nucleotidyltransferase